jgi:hypothetical protein
MQWSSARLGAQFVLRMHRFLLRIAAHSQNIYQMRDISRTRGKEKCEFHVLVLQRKAVL